MYYEGHLSPYVRVVNGLEAVKSTSEMRINEESVTKEKGIERGFQEIIFYVKNSG